VEQIDVPALLDLGDRAAGRLTGDAVRIWNTGPDRVTLSIRGEGQGLKPGAERVTVNPGETLAVPFRMELPPGVFGPVVGELVLAGRSVRYTVAVRAVARKVELRVEPGVVALGDLTPGAERPFVVAVENRGEMAVAIPESRAPGELEVWVPRARVEPGERVTLVGRVRVNAKQTGRVVRAVVPLVYETVLRVEARVKSPVLSRALVLTGASGGLIVCGACAEVGGWWLGMPLLLVGFICGLLAVYWHERG
jgi:hypothetical protein